MKSKGKLYLIPVPIGEMSEQSYLPQMNADLLIGIRHFVVENIRTARRFLRAANQQIVIDELSFYELNKHTSPEEIGQFIRPLLEGQDMGVISEAGCPAVADPGADVVALAQQHAIEVVPLVGPSSILMGLMGSGFNGQGFTFVGYLPIDEKERIAAIRAMEQKVYTMGQTQIFIETPYRNRQLAELLVKVCKPQTKFCIACDISTPQALIVTRTMAQWQGKLPDIHKRPTIFLLGR